MISFLTFRSMLKSTLWHNPWAPLGNLTKVSCHAERSEESLSLAVLLGNVNNCVVLILNFYFSICIYAANDNFRRLIVNCELSIVNLLLRSTAIARPKINFCYSGKSAFRAGHSSQNAESIGILSKASVYTRCPSSLKEVNYSCSIIIDIYYNGKIFQ